MIMRIETQTGNISVSMCRIFVFSLPSSSKRDAASSVRVQLKNSDIACFVWGNKEYETPKISSKHIRSFCPQSFVRNLIAPWSFTSVPYRNVLFYWFFKRFTRPRSRLCSRALDSDVAFLSNALSPMIKWMTWTLFKSNIKEWKNVIRWNLPPSTFCNSSTISRHITALW